MDKMTITEALAEIHVVEKRLAAKREFVHDNMCVDARLKDTVERKQVEGARQAIKDLEDRHLKIRMAINKANIETDVQVDSVKMTIAEWLVWRREISKGHLLHLRHLKQSADRAKKELLGLLNQPVPEGQPKPGLDFHVSPEGLATEISDLEAVLEKLDGKLSHKNATVFVEI